MKNANGYGSVYKMHGQRRRPYIAAVTITIDGKRTRKALGYYASRRDALAALAEYHNKPYDLSAREITVIHFFQKWLAYRDERKRGVQATAIYKSTFLNHCKPLFNIRFCDVQSIQIQLIKEFYDQGNGDFLCPVHRYDRLREKWKMCALPVIHNHLPHDGRHTCETLLDNARVAKRTIQLILGHAGKDVDEAVYTHKTRQQLIDAINQI